MSETPEATGAETPSIVTKDTAYRATGEGAELLRVDAGNLEAGTITMERSGAESITAERAILDRSGTQRLTTKSAQLDRSGAVVLQADNVVLQGSTALLAQAQEARITNSNILILQSGSTKVDGTLRTLVHIGDACDNVKPTFDPQGAAIFGAALALMLLIGGRVLRGIFGR